MRYPPAMLIPNQPAIILAPMEGVTDAPMRAFLTRSGFFDYCVSEFIRVSENVLSPKNFLKHIPELSENAKTPSGIPVQVQLLGGNPERLAESARNAILAGARAIDLNFGCPAPTVNRHDGGATLLKYPERLEAIIRAVREAVPAQFPVSAKMRLGFDDPSVIDENAKRAEQAGASWIAIHGRTKTQGYTPPAYWQPIGRVNKALRIPVIANGEIWNLDDFKRCRDETQCEHFMLGRGALAVPNLAREIRLEMGLSLINVPEPLIYPEAARSMDWIRVLTQFSQLQTSEKRMKQWLRYLHSKQNIVGWDELKTLGSVTDILSRLQQLLEESSFSLPASTHREQTEP